MSARRPEQIVNAALATQVITQGFPKNQQPLIEPK